jgi:hypothetical protein
VTLVIEATCSEREQKKAETKAKALSLKDRAFSMATTAFMASKGAVEVSLRFLRRHGVVIAAIIAGIFTYFAVYVGMYFMFAYLFIVAPVLYWLVVMSWIIIAAYSAWWCWTQWQPETRVRYRYA